MDPGNGKDRGVVAAHPPPPTQGSRTAQGGSEGVRTSPGSGQRVCEGLGEISRELGQRLGRLLLLPCEGPVCRHLCRCRPLTTPPPAASRGASFAHLSGSQVCLKPLSPGDLQSSMFSLVPLCFRPPWTISRLSDMPLSCAGHRGTTLPSWPGAIPHVPSAGLREERPRGHLGIAHPPIPPPYHLQYFLTL